jgi:anion-transporting  ArsA/GET3 family ATPase
MDNNNFGKVIAVISGKGGVGKSTVAPEFVIGTPKSGFLEQGAFLVPASERASL